MKIGVPVIPKVFPAEWHDAPSRLGTNGYGEHSGNGSGLGEVSSKYNPSYYWLIMGTRAADAATNKRPLRYYQNF